MKIILCVLFFIVSLTGIAQDQLFKKDNTKIDVKVIEINENEIKYKLFNYQDGPTIIVNKKDVAMIIYQNGSHEVFNATQPVETKTVTVIQPTVNTTASVNSGEKPELEELLKTKNLVSANILEPINGTFSISYFRELLKNNMNVYLPIGTGFSTPFLNQSVETTFNPHYYNYDNINNFKFTRKVAEIGLGIHFQTSGKKQVTHFVGPYFSFAQYSGTFDQQLYYNDPYTGYYTNQTIKHGFIMNRYYFMINNGILFRITKNFNMMMMAALGYSNNEFISNDPRSFRTYVGYSGYYPTERNIFPINAFKFNLSMGYRF